MKLGISVGIAMAVTASLMARQGPPAALAPAPESAKEVHLSNVRQLTFGGENAEAYFSSDGQELIFQSMRDGGECDQIYAMRTDGSQVRRVSSGEGRTTCSYFTPDKQHVVYASTYLGGKTCPPRPDFSRGYVWPVYDTYDIFKAKADGTGITRLTSTPGYDAEATIGPTGRIVFTSVRDGDMEIYSMNADGGDVKRLTNRVGPDGGPFFSPDGTQIVFRGRTLTPGPELDDYKTLLRDGLWRPTSLEIFVMNADGSQPAPGHLARRRELRAVLLARWPEDHLLVEPAQPARARLRALARQRRRHGARTRDVERIVRRLPDVLARRQEAGVCVEPVPEGQRRDQRVHRRLALGITRIRLDYAENLPQITQRSIRRLRRLHRF